MTRTRRRVARLALWILAPLTLLAVLRPWTIRPLEGSAPAAFEPERFAASAWPRLVREALQTASDVADVPPPTGAEAPKARFVKGAGTVSAIDRQSRAGVMRVEVTGARPATVALQIGPVVRGTALRDASSFIRFSDFTNQFDYAGAANALNDHALRTVVGPLPLDALAGRTISFIGAVGSSTGREAALEIVPVQVEIVEAAAR